MHWTKKIAKIADPDSYVSIWRGVKRAVHPQPVAKFLQHIDQPALAALGRRHAAAMKPGENWVKYFEAPRWLELNIRRAQDIGVDRAKRPLRVLDLGSGAGYFLFVCKHLDHGGMGLDVPEPEFYGEVFDLFGLQRVVAPVTKHVPLPEALLAGGKFDLVTAFSIAFNEQKNVVPWGPAEWGFLLDDLRNRFLLPGGRIYFDLNPGRDKTFMSPALREYFQRRGAKIDRRSKLLFDPLK